ncbi:MAG: hypothetical protein NC120_12215 [Ruminococcus sp.]|nr:hypothetical protein [Ruminococcus sp.]
MNEMSNKTDIQFKHDLRQQRKETARLLELAKAGKSNESKLDELIKELESELEIIDTTLQD